MIFGGIEGGATRSSLELYDEKGKCLAKFIGPHTNHWQTGMKECQRRIAEMVKEAKALAQIPEDKPLAALGLCLSGCGDKESCQLLEEGIRTLYPSLSEKYVICNDTLGAMASVSEKGGIVVISGTGSNTLLMNPDGSESRCGGWGHMLGDEGSAYWISHRAVQVYFHDQDNLFPPPHPTERIWKIIQEHFKIKDRSDLLDHCYRNFSKSHFAALCEKLAAAASEGDAMSAWLFAQAGELLARSIQAVVPDIQDELLRVDGGVPVVCVGSVWKSWDLMKDSFISQLKKPWKGRHVPELSLSKLNSSGAIGATLLAAKSIGSVFPCDYQSNYSVFYHYNPESHTHGDPNINHTNGKTNGTTNGKS